LLARLELAAHAQKPVRHLSGGLKQRLALAVALLADPPCLVLDEPTANLDTQAREAFLCLLSELKRSGKSLLFSSHRQEEVLALADRVLLLEQGRLVADATPAVLRQRPEWQTTLRLRVPPECLEPARRVLAEHGFLVSRNGQSMRVRVVPGEKGAPLHALMRANIPIDDFGLEHDNGEGETHA
jgi:ABC-type multidrug transport system ATPase subunit